jgi:hypothetical protein
VKRMALAGLLVVALAGCSVDPPQENDKRFTDMKVNGTRCIVYSPNSNGIGTTMQCDFAGYAPGPTARVDAGPPIDNTELSPPPSDAPAP